MHIAILAGGSSQRMGRDKLRLPWGGADLLQHVVDCAQTSGLPILLLGGERSLDGCTLLPDSEPGAGPLAALGGALAHSRDQVLLLAGDMPHMSRQLIDHLLAQATDRSLIVAGPHGLEPCCSIYAPDCLPHIERLLAAHRRSLKALIDAIDQPPHLLPVAHHQALVNINTPADWQALSQG